MPRKKKPHEPCLKCSCKVAQAWHTKELCTRYSRIIKLMTMGLTLAEIGRRVGLGRLRVREIVRQFDLETWRRNHPSSGVQKRSWVNTDLGLEIVIRQARRRGLVIEPSQDPHPWRGLNKKWLSIAGKPCQIMTAGFDVNPQYPHRAYIRIGRPRPEWAEFFIYVVMDPEEKEEPYCLIIPKRVVRKDTILLAGEGSSLAPFENAWHLLRGDNAQDVKDKLPDIARQTEAVIEEAERQGIYVERVRSKKLYPTFYARRLLIGEKRCEIRRAYFRHQGVNLNAPRTSWAEFIVYVVVGGPREFLIIPRDKIERNTHRSLNTSPLKEYRRAWHLLRPSHQP